MSDLHAVISGAIHEATGEGADAAEGVDAPETGGADGSAETTTETDATASVAASGDPAAPTPDGGGPAGAVDSPPGPSEDDRLLEEFGVKKAVGKDNRLPYSRLAPMLKSAQKKAAEAARAEQQKLIEERDAKIAEAQQRLQLFEQVDQLASSDPERYLSMLAALNPGYQRFLQQQAAAGAPAPTAPESQPPPPDAQFPDGSKGYSPEQHQKLLDWYAKQAEERAVKRVDAEYSKRFGPIEQQFQARQALEAQIPKVKAQIQQAKETWGEHFTKHEPEILAYLQANPAVSFEAGVAKVLIPKLQAERTAMRGELLKELEARPKAAAPAAPAPAKASTTPSDGSPRSLNDVIRESIAGLR